MATERQFSPIEKIPASVNRFFEQRKASIPKAIELSDKKVKFIFSNSEDAKKACEQLVKHFPAFVDSSLYPTLSPNSLEITAPAFYYEYAKELEARLQQHKENMDADEKLRQNILEAKKKEAEEKKKDEELKKKEAEVILNQLRADKKTITSDDKKTTSGKSKSSRSGSDLDLEDVVAQLKFTAPDSKDSKSDKTGDVGFALDSLGLDEEIGELKASAPDTKDSKSDNSNKTEDVGFALNSLGLDEEIGELKPTAEDTKQSDKVLGEPSSLDSKDSKHTIPSQESITPPTNAVPASNAETFTTPAFPSFDAPAFPSFEGPAFPSGKLNTTVPEKKATFSIPDYSNPDLSLEEVYKDPKVKRDRQNQFERRQSDLLNYNGEPSLLFPTKYTPIPLASVDELKKGKSVQQKILSLRGKLWDKLYPNNDPDDPDKDDKLKLFGRSVTVKDVKEHFKNDEAVLKWVKSLQAEMDRKRAEAKNPDLQFFLRIEGSSCKSTALNAADKIKEDYKIHKFIKTLNEKRKKDPKYTDEAYQNDLLAELHKQMAEEMFFKDPWEVVRMLVCSWRMSSGFVNYTQNLTPLNGYVKPRDQKISPLGLEIRSYVCQGRHTASCTNRQSKDDELVDYEKIMPNNNPMLLKVSQAVEEFFIMFDYILKNNPLIKRDGIVIEFALVPEYVDGELKIKVQPIEFNVWVPEDHLGIKKPATGSGLFNWHNDYEILYGYAFPDRPIYRLTADTIYPLELTIKQLNKANNELKDTKKATTHLKNAPFKPGLQNISETDAVKAANKFEPMSDDAKSNTAARISELITTSTKAKATNEQTGNLQSLKSMQDLRKVGKHAKSFTKKKPGLLNIPETSTVQAPNKFEPMNDDVKSNTAASTDKKTKAQSSKFFSELKTSTKSTAANEATGSLKKKK